MHSYQIKLHIMHSCQIKMQWWRGMGLKYLQKNQWCLGIEMYTSIMQNQSHSPVMSDWRQEEYIRMRESTMKPHKSSLTLRYLNFIFIVVFNYFCFHLVVWMSFYFGLGFSTYLIFFCKGWKMRIEKRLWPHGYNQMERRERDFGE